MSKCLIVAIACGLGCSIFAGVLAQSNKQMIVVPFDAARFAPLDAAQPNGLQFALLWGDPMKGPSAMLVRFKKGVSSLHYHSSDYHLAVLQGTMKHCDECLTFVYWLDKRDFKPAETRKK